ncbi:translation initiation factor IF-2 [Myxococcota bacterium]|nr:translation initiation factor IF-2 [Myxococcota bacterium]
MPESVARAAQQASQAQQVRPAEPKKEEEKPKVVAPPPVKGGEVRSLEDVLKEQGIVQHTPKKIRRVIDDGPMPTGRISQPGGAPRMPGPPPSAGAHGPPPMGRPVYGRGPAEAPAAPTGDAGARGKKGRRRKEVVQRQEMLYGGAGARARRKGAPVTPGRKTELTTPKASKRVIRVDNEISVSELAHQMGIKGSELIRKFIQMGQMVTVNQMVDNDTAAVIASDYGYEVENVGFREEEIIGVRVVEKDEDLRPRPPVVTIMGHVDHGKTSLLDVIRKANVAAREAGGITQHIGAYQVTLKNGQQITFLDTPGHEAFTAMRARGAQVTDIVVLVVAADDGVMPQTAEAVNHAKAAGVPIIVAVNKIDKPNANPDKIKQGLTEFELVPEEWGGDTLMVPVSAKEKIGIDELLEAISLQAEILDLKANPEREARGVIIESKLDKGRGPVATVLIQHGTIKPGDFVVAGTESGKVRAMVDENGKMVKKAGPATPVEILGLSGVPNAGDELVVVEDDKAAKTLAEHRADLLRQTQLSKSSRVSYEDLLSRMKEGEVKELNLILKSDVQGSIEALRAAFSKIEVADTRINILHAAVGGITENDVTLASASRATVLGFNVRPDVKALKAATESGVEVRTYKVIYEAVDDLKKALVGMLEPTFREDVHGHAEVRNTFNIPKVGTVAGLFVTDGKLARQHQVRLLRDSVVVWTGRLSSLKRFKDDVRDVTQGYECGAGLDGFNDVKVGDVLESFTVEQVQATG